MRSSTWLLLCGSLIVLAACKSKSGVKDGGAGTANTLDKGFCADSCPKPCDQDNDCMTSKGELCCDFGGDGKACTAAKECPRQCLTDTKCDTVQGEACVRVTLQSKATVCTEAALGLQLCKKDGDCNGKGDVCCAAYKEPVCLPANRCPSTCVASKDCDTGNGEVCCAALPMVDKTLKTGGVCVSPSVQPCPTACKQSTDCNTKRGELCCDGFCSDSCEHACSSSSDCSGQLCCKTRAARSLLANGAPRPGYVVAGNGSGMCSPGMKSTPGSLDDPCPQTGTACAQAGMFAVSTCQADGTWSLMCACVPGGSSCMGFRCNDGSCLPITTRCNGVTECKSGDDELGCPMMMSCTGFRCADGTCLPAVFRCDGVTQCASSDDELGCPSTACTGFRCASGTCVPASFKCDGISDCSGGDDELGCSTTCTGYKCATSGTCISATWRCDGFIDCPGGDDEAKCADGG
jgi:hypothetical protein